MVFKNSVITASALVMMLIRLGEESSSATSHIAVQIVQLINQKSGHDGSFQSYVLDITPKVTTAKIQTCFPRMCLFSEPKESQAILA